MATTDTDKEYRKEISKSTEQAELQGKNAKTQLDSSYELQKEGYKDLGNVYKENAEWENEGREDVEKSRKAASDAYDALMNENKPLTESETARQRKRRRNSALWAAIGDGISSIASVVSAANYGQPFKGDKTMSERMRERWRELDDERRDKNNLYLNALGKKHDLLKDAYNQYRAEHKDKTEAKAAGANVNIEIGKVGTQLARDKFSIDKDVAGTKVNNAEKVYDASIRREQLEESKRQHRDNHALQRKEFDLAERKYNDGKKNNSITVRGNDGTDEVLYFSDSLKGALLAYAEEIEENPSLWGEKKTEEELLTDLEAKVNKNADVSRKVKDIIRNGTAKPSVMTEDEVANYEIKQ